MTDEDRILVVPTGGTFESEPYEDRKHPPSVVSTLKGEDSLLPETLKGLPHGGDAMQLHRWEEAEELRFNKDSKKFAAEDIRALADFIRNDKHRCFLLAHGTDHLALNAEMLQKELAGTNKTVVLTGAMVPLSMPPSDGPAALDYVLEHIKDKDPGVYIAGMHAGTGRRGFFNPGSVDKDWARSIDKLTYTLGVPGRDNKSYLSL